MRRSLTAAAVALLSLACSSAAAAQSTIQTWNPGPHAIGGGLDSNSQLILRGYFSGQSDTRTLDIQSALQGLPNYSAEGINVRPAFILPPSGRVNNFEGIDVLLSIPPQPGTGWVSQIDGILVRSFVAPPGTEIATGIYVYAAPEGAVENISLWIGGGLARFSGPVEFTPAGFNQLGAARDGTERFCADCDPGTNVICSSSGLRTGAKAVRVNGAWRCSG